MSVRSLDGKKCLITGAGSGIGRATALRASEAGAELFLTDINNLGLEETVAMVGAAGGTVSMAKALDISDYDEVVKFGTEIHTQFSPMDVVMNIAGISAWGTIENLEHRHWKSMVDVNLMGPIHVMETFVPPMIRAARVGTWSMCLRPPGSWPCRGMPPTVRASSAFAVSPKCCDSI
ncbi:hypothetical protein GCM10020255_099400 [Rhodococcus baikonurensis]